MVIPVLDKPCFCVFAIDCTFAIVLCASRVEYWWSRGCVRTTSLQYVVRHCTFYCMEFFSMQTFGPSLLSTNSLDSGMMGSCFYQMLASSEYSLFDLSDAKQPLFHLCIAIELAARRPIFSASEL